MKYLWNRPAIIMKYRNEIAPQLLWKIVMKSPPNNYEISQWNRPPIIMKYCNEIAPQKIWIIAMKSLLNNYEKS